MPPHNLLLLLCLWPASSRCDSFLVKGPAILAQEEGLKAAADGRYSEAVEKLRRALKGAPESTAGEQQHVATVRNALGGALNSLGRYSEAAPLFETALATFQRAAAAGTGDEARAAQSEAAVVMNNLGSVRAETGRRAEARALYEGAMSLFDEAAGGGGGGGDDGGDDDDDDAGGGGRRDPRQADAINNLADLSHSEGSLVDAERLYKSALELRQSALGEDHPTVAGSVNNLAVLLMDQRHAAEALPLLRRAAKLAKAQLGKEHPHYATTLNNLAAGRGPHVEAAGGRAGAGGGEWCVPCTGPRAEPAPRVGASPPWALCCRRLRPERRPTPRDPPPARTLHSSRVCLGRLEQQGLHKEAMRHMTRALKINTRAFGEEHASTKDTAANLHRLRDEL
jgi:tetratricopeptide (TPR) repeat protein